MMFGEVVMGVDMAHFDEIFDARKEEKGVADDAGLNADDMIYISNAFLKKYKEVKANHSHKTLLSNYLQRLRLY